MALGLGFIFAGAFYGDHLPSHRYEVAVTMTGSLLMIAAHRMNHTFCSDCRPVRMIRANGSWLGPFDVHEEVVHRPVGFDATLTDQSGELRVVTDAVQKRVEEDGFAVGAERAHGAGGEVQRFVPVDIRGEELLEDGDRAVVGGVDGFDGVEGDSGVVGDGEAGEAFGVA